MNKVPKRSQQDYTLSFKLAVVEQVERGEMTYRQAQARYGIQGKSTVLVWLRKHGKLRWDSTLSACRRTKSATVNKPMLTPEQRIKELEQQLHAERQKAQFFEAVVDVMQRDYGATLVKKPVGKSSPKKPLSG